MPRFVLGPIVGLVCLSFAAVATAAGTLVPAGAGDRPLRILEHHVQVVIDNGFSRTEVKQVFENPNAHVVEGIYTLPLPDSAALSEMTVSAGDRTLFGEVIPRRIAEEIYEAERRAGGDAGLATKEGYQRFEFRIASIPAGGRVVMTFAYYQPADVDLGVGRYLYPLEEGDTDGGAAMVYDTVDGELTASFEVRSAWPVDDVRLPGHEGIAERRSESPGHWRASVRGPLDLDRDLVLEYELKSDLPGRIDVVPYRRSGAESGTFMMLLTPGSDLTRLDNGVDYVFVLDTSGSMEGNIDALASAIDALIQSLGPNDRFRIVTFSDSARMLTPGWIGPGPGVGLEWAAALRWNGAEGGTDLYEGVQLGLSGLRTHRTTSVFLLTDAVTNTGVLDGPSFIELLAEQDVRVFGFLMGNSANWPLMQLVTDVSGGFYTPVSNMDDIAGQIARARAQMSHEALHGFTVTVDGAGASGLAAVPRTATHGDQIVAFGKYAGSGSTRVTVTARVGGVPASYEATVTLPEVDERFPELERLWALAKVEELELAYSVDLLDRELARADVEQIGVEYQIVTDETSMILLTEEALRRYGIDPRNRERSLTEEEARAARDEGEPVGTSSGDGSSGASTGYGGTSSGGYSGSGSDSWGGGAIGTVDALALAGGAAFLLLLSARRRRRRR